MYSPAWVADHPGPYGVLGDPDMPAHARRGLLRAGHEPDAWDALPTIGAPTLILHGGQDRLTPVANLSLLAARIPDARTHVFPGARHAYFEECRPAASALVTGFLTGDIDDGHG
ncbi:alpha/beta fold hydrolase [Streptomyces puniciscabiei]|uniref:alpha/beta fold hydrolase n=1 Tax=Streptomyces puniciscabiei TaxID=164348 RepID=UPI0037B06DB5